MRLDHKRDLHAERLDQIPTEDSMTRIGAALQIRPQLWSSVLGRVRGVAMLELVMVLALVVAVAVAGVSVLGHHTSQTTRRISVLQSPNAPAPAIEQASVVLQSTAAIHSSRDTVAAATAPYVQWAIIFLLFCCLILQSAMTFGRIGGDRANKQDPLSRDSDPKEALFDKRQAMLREMTTIAEHHQLAQLTVGQVMSMRLTVVARTASVDELVGKLKSEGRHHLIVSEDAERLEGIISDRDLSQRDGKCAADVMTRACMSVSPQTDLLVAATTMINHGISALPVLDHDKLVGILTTTDLTLALQCLLLLAKRDEALAEKVSQLLA